MKMKLTAAALIAAMLVPMSAWANMDDPSDLPAPKQETGRIVKTCEPLPVEADAQTWDGSSGVDQAGCATGHAAPGSAADFRSQGVVSDANGTYTWYSERVLPGGGLDIPGRHVNGDGFVCDANGNICVANSDLPRGATVQTPWGQGVVYDSGCASGVTDVYTNF